MIFMGQDSYDLPREKLQHKVFWYQNLDKNELNNISKFHRIPPRETHQCDHSHFSTVPRWDPKKSQEVPSIRDNLKFFFFWRIILKISSLSDSFTLQNR